ncbi:MAG: hypothetical protein NT169_03720 [Chloroflexi bacterium]|nr:hypothetical protein [Chloroflexota bacterium]
MNSTTIRPHLRSLAALLLALLTLTGCTLLPAGRAGGAGSARSVRLEEATPTPIPTPVTVAKPTYTVVRGEVVKTLLLGGRVSPVTQTDLFFKVGGRVRTVYVKSGDNVKAGALLADLEMANAERDLVSVRLDLDRAQARLKTAQSDVQANLKRAQANLDIAKENLAIIEGQDPTPRKVKAEVALQRADLARKQAQDAYDAIAWRNDRGASPQAMALQQATLNYQDAQAAYDLAMQDIVTHGHQITIAERQVDLAQLTLDSLSGGVDPLLVNDVSKAQLAVTKLEAAVSDAQIVAPFNGQVQVAFILSEGTAIDAFRPVATVSDLSVLEVRVDTLSVGSDDLSVDMPATVSFVGRPGVEMKGRIRQLPASGVLATIAQDKSLHIALEDPGISIGYASGDLTRIAIVLERKQDVLWLPPMALRTFEGRRFVVVQESGGQRRVDVKVGLEGDDRIEIASGLTEGQIVVGQ